MHKPLIALLVLAALPGAALAHHGWGSYDSSKVFTIKSPVEALDWHNPHVTITVKHEGQSWQATLAPISRMQRRGLSEAMLAPGKEIAVEGYPSTRVQHEMRAERITVGEKAYELR
ncbi:MAG TPA: DUF6152 family protein [Aestuariivirgaceae bacterium]|jgi:Family of unknown function (DUF6152)|nr:DUF6152 family protein [Aestuariivirgaceae bacterium]